MNTYLYKKITCLLGVIFILQNTLSAQNLVLNPSFETVNLNNLQCSWYTTQGQFNNVVSNWTVPTGGSSDIFHTSLATTCFSSPFSTNIDAIGQQAPRTGESMSAIYVYGSGGCDPYREYIQGSLSSPLQVGQTYEVEFFVSLADQSRLAANNLGVKFSTTQYNTTNMCVYNTTPELNYTSIITDKTGWTKISFCFTPTTANFRYFIIGNFYSDAATSTQALNSGGKENARYYIDDVRIEAVNNTPTTTTSDTVRACQPGNINLFNQISSSAPTNGTWTGPSNLSGGYLGTFNPANNTYGTYTYTSSGGNCGGSTTAKVVVLGQSASLTATLAQTQTILCNGDRTGINTTITGGAAPYSYSWNSGQTTQNLTNITPGTYTIQITDAIGCSTSRSLTISQPSAITNTISQTQPVLCFGNSSAVISNNVSGGTAPYSYSWNSGQTTANINNLPAGFYKVEIRDANNCVRYDSLQITQPSILSSSIASNNPILCNGNTTGINTTVTGGTTPYNYSWNTGATSQNLTNVGSGTYTLTITDANNCSTNNNLTITQPAAISSSISQDLPIICNSNTTNVNLTVTNGSAPYSYSWSNGATSQNITNVTAGTYSVQITDANNCTANDNITITQPALLANTISQTQNILCFGNSSAAISNNVSGGTAPYSYSWNSGQTTTNISNLPAGFYKVEIRDANNCVRYDSLQITQPTDLTSSLANAGPILCSGNTTGVNTTVTGGTTPYAFSWSNNANTQNLTNLTAGTYSVTITDANNCINNNAITITEPTALAINLQQTTPILCNGDLTGVNNTITGGTGPYSFNWSNGATSQNLSNINAGTFSLTVTDANNCTANNNITITQPALLANTISQTQNILCFGDNAGTISNNASGGTAPYSYSWNSGQTTANISNLPAGFYKVEVRDANNCARHDSLQITQPQLISANFQNIICNASSYILPSGKLIQNSGIYVDTISAVNGCDSIITLDLTLSNIQVSTNPINHISCFGYNDGSVTVIATGGVQPYSYLWNNNQTTVSINNLSPGNYAVITKDSVNCSDTLTINITSPTELIASTSPSAEFCQGNSTLLIASASGGTLPHNISWSNNVNSWSQTVQPNSSTTYTATVTDNNGCVSSSSSSITVFPNPIAIVTTDSPSPTTAGITITFTDNSKLGDFNYWDLKNGNSHTNKEQIVHTFEEEGEYCIDFTTSTIHNCTDATSVCVIVNPEYTLYIPNSFTPNGDKKNESFRVVGRGFLTMKMYIFNRWGQELILLEGDQPVNIGWNGYYKDEIAPAGVYTYKLEVIDLKNNLHSYFGHINLIR